MQQFDYRLTSAEAEAARVLANKDLETNASLETSLSSRIRRAISSALDFLKGSFSISLFSCSNKVQDERDSNSLEGRASLSSTHGSDSVSSFATSVSDLDKYVDYELKYRDEAKNLSPYKQNWIKEKLNNANLDVSGDVKKLILDDLIKTAKWLPKPTTSSARPSSFSSVESDDTIKRKAHREAMVTLVHQKTNDVSLTMTRQEKYDFAVKHGIEDFECRPVFNLFQINLNVAIYLYDHYATDKISSVEYKHNKSIIDFYYENKPELVMDIIANVVRSQTSTFNFSDLSDNFGESCCREIEKKLVIISKTDLDYQKKSLNK